MDLSLDRASSATSPPTSSPYQEYKTPGDIALWVIETHKPLHHDKVTVPGEEKKWNHAQVESSSIPNDKNCMQYVYTF